MNRLSSMGVVPGLTLGTQLGRSASLSEQGVVAACSAAHLFDTIAPGFTRFARPSSASITPIRVSIAESPWG